MIPGEIITKEGSLILNQDRETKTLTVANTGDRPVQSDRIIIFMKPIRALILIARRRAVSVLISRRARPSGSSRARRARSIW